MRAVPLRRAFAVINGGTPTSDPENWDGNVPWATPIDLALVNGARLATSQRSITRRGLASGSALVPSGALIVSTRAPIGYVAETTAPTAFNQGCRGLVPRDEVDIRFFRYQLLSLAGQLQARGQGSTFMELSTDGLASFPLFVPSLAEQRVIADDLDAETARIDRAVNVRRNQVELLWARYNSLRKSIVLHDVDPVTGTGASPSTWERPLLGVLIELQRGIDLPADSREAGPVPVVSSGGITGSHSVAACPAPGVVTGRYGTVGAVYYIDQPYWPLNTTLFVSDFRGNNPRWVFHLMNAMPLDIDAEKSAVTGINRNVIGQLRAVRPPIVEQREIAAELDRQIQHSELQRRILQRQIDLLLERRQALIAAAVTGEVAVRG